MKLTPNLPTYLHTLLYYSPWKKVQLGYLRTIQAHDLLRRRTVAEGKNEMFVARRVVPMTTPTVAKSTPLILDLDRIQNGSSDGDDDYVRGEILGFCEVSERPYGLLDDKKDNNGPQQPVRRTRQRRKGPLRPILTNLSVKCDARSSGIGGQLVQACEQIVAGSWTNYNEIVLEVETDNESALEFYEKRGYDAMFTDPACRRYSTKGFFLGKERCSKICMRKHVEDAEPELAAENGTKMDLSKVFQNLRETVFTS